MDPPGKPALAKLLKRVPEFTVLFTFESRTVEVSPLVANTTVGTA